MCLDFPARVVERDGNSAVVEAEGRRRRASALLVPDVLVGEWVYVAAGTIVERLAAAEALLITEELSRARGATP